ncbi:hypothetical protein FQZ97_944540 [compost metagenome]
MTNFICGKWALVLRFVGWQGFANGVYLITAGSQGGDCQFENSGHAPLGLCCNRWAIVLSCSFEHFKDVGGSDGFDRQSTDFWKYDAFKHLESFGLGDLLPVLQR